MVFACYTCCGYYIYLAENIEFERIEFSIEKTWTELELILNPKKVARQVFEE